MEINNLNQESYVTAWANEIKDKHQELNFGQLFMAHKEDSPSINVIHQIIIKVEGDLQNKKALRCSALFARIYPEFFDINLKGFKFPEKPEEKKAVLEILLRADLSIKKLKLKELSLDEILEFLPENPSQPHIFLAKFEELGLKKHLKNAGSPQALFDIVDRILKQHSWAAKGLVDHLKSVVKRLQLSFEQELDLYQKIEGQGESLWWSQLKCFKKIKKIRDPETFIEILCHLKSKNLAEEIVIKELFLKQNYDSLSFKKRFEFAQSVVFLAGTIPNSFYKKLNLTKDLEQAQNKKEFLEIYEKITSLGPQAVKLIFQDDRFIEKIPTEFQLDLHEKVLLLSKLAHLGDGEVKEIEKYLAWMIDDKEQSNDPLEQRNLIFKLTEQFLKEEEHVWLANLLPGWENPTLSIEDRMLLLEMWAQSSPESIPIIVSNIQGLSQAIGKVIPTSLRLQYCKRMSSVSDSFIQNMMKNIQYLNIGDFDNEEKKLFFLSIATYDLLPQILSLCKDKSLKKEIFTEVLFGSHKEKLKSIKELLFACEEFIKIKSVDTISLKHVKDLFIRNFNDLGFIDLLNKSDSPEILLDLIDEILNSGHGWLISSLVNSLSLLDLAKLDLEQKVYLYQKIEKKHYSFMQVTGLELNLQDLKKIVRLICKTPSASLISYLFDDKNFVLQLPSLKFQDKFLLMKAALRFPYLKQPQLSIYQSLNFMKNLQQSSNAEELLHLCKEIISLGSDIAKQLFVEEHLIENIPSRLPLNFQQRISLLSQFFKRDTKFPKNPHMYINWIKDAKQLPLQNDPLTLKNYLFELTEEFAKAKDNFWIFKTFCPWENNSLFIGGKDIDLSMENRMQLLEILAKSSPELAINTLIKNFILSIGQVQPISLRLEYCKRTASLSESFAQKLIDDFKVLDLGNLSEKENDDFFLNLGLKGLQAAHSAISHITDPKKRLLLCQATAFLEDPSTKPLLLGHQFPEDDKDDVLEYIGLLTKQSLAYSHLSAFLSLYENPQIKREIFAEVMLDPQEKNSKTIKELSLIKEEEIPFFVKNPEKITEEDIISYEKMIENSLEMPKTLIGLFNTIKEKNNSLSKNQLLKWFVYTSTILTTDKAEKKATMLSHLEKYQNPSLRFILTRLLSEVKEIHFKPSKKESPKTKALEELSSLILSRWIEKGWPKEEVTALYDKIVQKSLGYKDTKQSSTLLQFLVDIAQAVPSFEEKQMLIISSVVKDILNEPPKTAITHLETLKSMLSSLGQETFLSCLNNYPEESPSQFFMKKFREILPVNIKGDFDKAFKNTFMKFRKPNAIFNYLGSLNQLPFYQRGNAIKALTTYVEWVLSEKENFNDLRCSTDNERSPHLKKIFSSQKGVRKNWLNNRNPEIFMFNDPKPRTFTIGTSTSAEDLLLIGDIPGSCLSVKGNPHKNKGLLGYLLHGDTLLVLVKDEDGVILCRGVLRLMWDEKNQSAVLLQEPRYGQNPHPLIEEAINKWAIEKAQAMKIPLVSVWVNKNENKYDGTVNFLGGPAPFLHTDSGEGVVENGHLPFEIPNCHMLYSP